MKKQEHYTVHKWTNPHLQHLIEQEHSELETKIESTRQRVGAQLKRERTRQRVTQKQLSAITGVPQVQISLIENGREAVALDTLTKLAAGLGKQLELSFSELEEKAK